MKRYKKLAFDTLTYAVGNFGSRLIGIIMLPLYTYYLSQEDYGLIDLLTTTLLLIMPIFSFNIVDALLRFGLDGTDENKDYVVTNSFFTFLLGFLFLLLFYPLLITIDFIEDYYFVFYLLFFLQAIESMFKQFLRSLDLTKSYMISDIIYSVVLSITNVIFIVILRTGIQGYFCSMIFSSFFDIVYIVYKGKVLKRIKIRYIDKNLISSMLKFSVPLIPNSIMWWVMNASNRYFIKYFLGLSFTGVYAVANRFPTIITLLNKVFFLAWQVMAIKEFNSSDKDYFQTKVFNIFYFFMVMISSIYITFNEFIISFLVSKEFKEAYLYSPILVIAAVFLSLATFLGTNYAAAKETKGALWTTLFGALVNIVLNFVLIPNFGLFGASFACLIGYFCVWIIRVFSTKKYVDIRYDVTRTVISLIILFIQLYLTLNGILNSYFIGIISFFLIFLISLKYYKKLLCFGLKFLEDIVKGKVKFLK